MASLTQVAIVSRKTIRFGIYSLILVIVARTAFRMGYNVYTKFFPPPPPEPTVAFDKLPKLPFPQKEKPTNLEYILETPDGKLPSLPSQTEVYFMPPIASNIKAVDNAKQKAQNLGFDPNGKPIVENVQNVYVFTKLDTPTILTMNIITGAFSISYDLNANPTVISGTFTESLSAIEHVKGYLNVENQAEEINKNIITNELLKIENAKFVKADSLSEAEIIKVNIFRKNLGSKKDIPSVTPDMPEANVWAMVTGKLEVIAAEYHFFPLDEGRLGTYPLKTSEQAWEELKKSEGYIANLGERENDKITIRKIYLAYYDAGQYMEFYQPVIVFEGDGGFYAFVPAIQSDLYGAEAKTDQ